MNFTPQQLAGGGSYNCKTRVGNWHEDVCLEETKFADFKRARATGTLTMGMFNKKVATCTSAVPHSFSEDGCLRYGDSIVIAHKETGGSLACDPFESAGFDNNEFAASVCESTSSMARNTFVIVKAEENSDDDLVRWGTPFRIMCNQSLRVDDKTNMLQPPLYLASNLKNERKASPLSNNQLVYMTPKPSYSTCWVANMPALDKFSGASRMLAVGEPITVGCDVALQHCATRQLLSSDSKLSMQTDFGTEYEVCGKTNVKTGKISVMAGEFSGQRTPATNCKPELSQNVWSFVTSADPAAGEEFRNLPPPLSPEGLIAKVLGILKARSKNAVRGLKSAFKAMDDVGDYKLDKEDLKWGLRDLGVDLDDEQFGVLFTYFDKGGDGIISLTEFLTAIRGEMNDFRVGLVLAAYDKLDADGSGLVNIDDIVSLYNIEADPMVAEGVKTVDEAAKEFMSLWETDGNGVVTKEEFIEYYKDLSAEIDDDAQFELIMQSAWGL
ncbi:hypothetical protein TrVE_jg7309 [Triparma verrucosa]|uniref:EF-hand domain-containing protein n=1 Tax=Triparma verrucosa TaxID=1606542 RepID=A0A9W7F282_9STRA|nr:hypothetical protein TrVE_jg7309 [Triparma verrucosa]